MYNQPRGGSRRGRGRGRGQHIPHFPESHFNTIHSKLVGTVYDLEFDDDSPSDSVENLRAMRERRRSTDIHERKLSENSFLSHDSPPSPKFTSPLHHIANSKLRSSYNADIQDLRPPSPLPGLHSSADELLPLPSPVNNTTSGRLEQFPDVVQPLLPGPVDMRTYSSSYEPTPSNNPATYHNHLLGTSFTTSTAEQHVTDFVEDLEKELHSALAARKQSEPQKITEEVSKQMDEAVVGSAANDNASSNSKVSLSDSRNQLKVKIKGPFLDANYAAASNVPPLTQQQPLLPVMPALDAVAVSNIIPSAATASSSSGTSNLRRMRKKELLRQYCSQDMNMDDPAGGAVTGQATAPTTVPPVNRTVITIPKAVASMTSIPTREDYKAVVDANMEKKRRKEKAFSSSQSVPRELRHLDLPLEQDDVCPPERRRSVGSTGSNASSTQQPDITTPPIKRRGRPPKSVVPASGPILVLAPKLKIKIGNSIIGAPEAESNIEEKKLRIRPPKKRLTSVQMPTVEELKRESMKFRRMIMADFDEAEKKQSKVVSGKRRKQRQFDSSQHEVQIITADEKVSAPKLIIRFNKRSTNSINNSGANSVGGRGSTPVPQLSDSIESRVGICGLVNTRADPSVPPSSESENQPSTMSSVSANSNSGGDAKGSEPLNVRTSKVTPIRLKLARCQEGYVMKTQPSQDTAASGSVTPNSAEGDDRSTLPENEVCEVR